MNLDLLKSFTILYVEDEPLIRQNALEYLNRYCHTVYGAKDGLEGLQMYQKYHPDLIISDIKMPRLNGLEFAEQIRQTDKTTPIIIATAHTETDYLLKAIELQLIKYIIKPITKDKLSEALQIVLKTLEDNNHTLHLTTNTLYDTLNKTLIIDNHLIKLTYNEQLFFNFLIKNRQRTITYKEIENLIWTYEGMSMDALRSLVRGLRKKLKDDYIENISGIGYRLNI